MNRTSRAWKISKLMPNVVSNIHSIDLSSFGIGISIKIGVKIGIKIGTGTMVLVPASVGHHCVVVAYSSFSYLSTTTS